MATMNRIRKNGKTIYTKAVEFDESPLYAVEVRADGTLDHSSAFDPKYECECDDIDGRHALSACGWNIGIRGSRDETPT